MSEKTLQTFIDSIVNYFNHTSDNDAKVGTPFLVENNDPAALDYTGIIGVSGPIKGCVYFSAPSILLKHLLLSIGETETHEANIIDIVGEVANTLAGNARKEFGREFMISVPIVVKGKPSSIHLPRDSRSYVIPISWKSYQGIVVICLSPEA